MKALQILPTVLGTKSPHRESKRTLRYTHKGTRVTTRPIVKGP